MRCVAAGSFLTAFVVFTVVNIVVALTTPGTKLTINTSIEQIPLRNTKTILLWNDLFSLKHFGLPLGRKGFAGCKVSNCEVWDRLDLEPDLPHDEYDALVFHGIDTGMSSMHVLPLIRSPHQRYMFFLHESPIMRPKIYNFKNFFNWTATYRRDSDFPMLLVDTESMNKKRNREMMTVWREPTFENMSHIPEYVGNKNKLVVWFVSNVYSQSKRHVYVNALSKHISVDIYGRGRELTCNRNDNNCELMLDKTYKFYLAFENSLCHDYVTEKMSRAFDHNIIPIVYGGADYKAFAPPLSYIDVKDYASPEKLAKYLHYLDKHPQEYKKYFWWKKFYRQRGSNVWCDICEKLNNSEEPNRVYPDMELWWKYPGVCPTPEAYWTRIGFV